ncbi:amino acid adenylation domain-containing protein [Catenulispora pinisilvae]|uniref:amino acid adenylation domain-containing protein n=1 Tax=Catenulispora pinisilvae TaxID=2705253 RepID=UPI0018913E53|nr:non-ribosomal peptide synthetase [Catenulispora pinisilvae]
MRARSSSGNRTSSPVERCVHEMFADHATAFPDRVALTGPRGDLSYGELDARAERLATRLVRSGAERDTAVGVLLERSEDFVLSALAVLKAGGCYVPLDPSYPDSRLRLMLDAAGVRTVVTNSEFAARVPNTGAEVEIVDCRDQDSATRTVGAAAPDRASAREPHPAVAGSHGDSLAYIMFTSGSTGTPKAAAIRHAGVARLVNEPDYVRLDADVVMANISSVSFDAATFEIWGALANGGRLVIGPPGPSSALELGRYFVRHGINCAFLTSGLFNLIVDECLEDLGGFTQLITGGDVVSPRQARRFIQAHPRCRLVNGYGPTEMTTFTACHHITLEDTRHERIPIGKPIRGTRVEILDKDLRPAAVGTPGMLYAGGPGIFRGYLNDKKLTAERTIPAPRPPGGRLYATQDLAMYRPDGSIDFLGRLDGQIKKRGYRVEPGEIEEALRADPVVRQAALALIAQSTDDAVLAAYVVLDGAGGRLDSPRADPRAQIAGIRERLRQRLPSHLIPDRLVIVEALPLSVNGKVDRRALAALSASDGRASADDHAARATDLGDTNSSPATQTEQTLIAIWREVMAVSDIGREDDFFDLGGQSLQASRMISRIRSALGVEVPLSLFFDHPTVADLARLIDEG